MNAVLHMGLVAGKLLTIQIDILQGLKKSHFRDKIIMSLIMIAV